MQILNKYLINFLLNKLMHLTYFHLILKKNLIALNLEVNILYLIYNKYNLSIQQMQTNSIIQELLLKILKIIFKLVNMIKFILINLLNPFQKGNQLHHKLLFKLQKVLIYLLIDVVKLYQEYKLKYQDYLLDFQINLQNRVLPPLMHIIYQKILKVVLILKLSIKLILLLEVLVIL